MEGELRFIDLFCGIGGFRQALEKRGHRCVLSSDWDPHAQFVYEKNYGEKPLGDINKIETRDIPDYDLLCGGFPCQPFSISGSQRGFEDARGTLLYQILRIVEHSQPKVILLENVRNYLTHQKGRTMEATLKLLREAGYDVFFEVLNSSDFGVPQKRERLFFVCFRKDSGVDKFQFPQPEEVDVALEDILLSETLSAFGGGVGAKTGMYLFGNRIRRLHPFECQKIMGFPDDFILDENPNVSYKQFGNSVVVSVVSAITEEIEKALAKARLLAA
jgi:DNA (cytosine-5)-methyltransferase 1